jgi:hypothetical protein
MGLFFGLSAKEIQFAEQIVRPSEPFDVFCNVSNLISKSVPSSLHWTR